MVKFLEQIKFIRCTFFLSILNLMSKLSGKNLRLFEVLQMYNYIVQVFIVLMLLSNIFINIL